MIRISALAVFALISADSLLAQAPPAAPAAPAAIQVQNWDKLEWKPSASLPVGAEYHLIYEDPASGGIQAFVRFPKGYLLPAHRHLFDETLTVIEGKLRIQSDGIDRVIETGGYASVPKGLSHSLKAEGRKGVVFILVTNGPFGIDPIKK